MSADDAALLRHETEVDKSIDSCGMEQLTDHPTRADLDAVFERRPPAARNVTRELGRLAA